MKKFLPQSYLSGLFASLLIFGISQPIKAQSDPLDDLLKQVFSDQRKEVQENKKREAEFIAQKNQREMLLNNAQQELKAAEEQTAKLKDIYSKNEKELTDLEEKLRQTMGTLGEMFGVVRQVAGDSKAQFESSIISSQIPGRHKFMEKLAGAKAIPDVKELEKIWFELQREMTESSKVVKYPATVTFANGKKEQKNVTRIGVFNAVVDGKFLNFLPETQQLVELGRQPQSRYLSMAEDLEQLKEGFTKFAIDPSRGTILSMLVQAPSLSERVQQGGIVGYVILAVLLLGLAMVVERLFYLNKVGKRIYKQIDSNSIDTANPLGKILSTYKANIKDDYETLELKISEAVLKAIPPLERGIRNIKVLAAVAPLLGLLGTVTGMIATFQSITLFGTGDPKLMAGGISQALVTTVLGLVAAIPLILTHSLISNKSNELIQTLEEQSAGLIATHAEKEKGVLA
ncbi:MAG: MotA/TolQ/ExbB proton channel family protein [Bdellovibrionota bacterium]